MPGSKTGIDFKLRREIAQTLEHEMHATNIEWVSDVKGICECPNKGQHSGSNRTECVIWIDGNFDQKDPDSWPTKKCAHNHCQEHPLIKQFNHELRSRIGRAEHREDSSTPNAYLKSLYPELADKYGDPLEQVFCKEAADTPVICKPVRLNERFFAAMLAREGNAKDPSVFDRDENKWFRYCPEGFYKQVKPEEHYELLNALLLNVARKCAGPTVDTKPLEFKLRNAKTFAPIVAMASGAACVDSTVWHWPTLHLPVSNGVLRIEAGELSPHSPDSYFRGVLGVPYQPGAKCPKWERFLEEQAPEDADLLRRLAGLLLTGCNSLQILSLLIGAPASGKGTVIKIFIGLVGAANAGSLRTKRLDSPFEMARHRHKLMLYGADVDKDFLSNEGAYLLKAITGQDPISPEYKHSNAVPPAEPIRACIMLTANSRLRIRFQGDKPAWRRRLVVIPFEREVPETERIPQFAEQLLLEEGGGILNWALEGLRKLEGGVIALTERQQKNRDQLLDESESSVAFAREAVEVDPQGRLLAADAYTTYVQFCTAKGWAPETPQRFQTEFKQAVVDYYGTTQSHDLLSVTGNRVRGWGGVRLKNRDEDFEEG